MFFLIRSAVCIGLVAAAASEQPMADRDPLGGVMSAVASSSTATLIRFCGISPGRCLRPLSTAAAGPAIEAGADPRRLPLTPVLFPHTARTESRTSTTAPGRRV